MITGKKILIISPESWDHVFVSKHHYASELASCGNAVFFLNPPSHGFRSQSAGGITIVNAKGSISGLRKFPDFISSLLIEWELNKLENRLGVHFDIIWNFDPSRFFNLSRVNDKIKVCHIVDWNQNYQRELLAKTCDICLTTSDFLKQELLKINSLTFNIGHGCIFKSNDKRPMTSKPKPDEISVGYVGNLDIKYLDWDLLTKLALDHSHIHFSFVGPISSEKFASLNLSRLKNVSFEGKIPSIEIPSKLEQFDVLLIAYLADDHKEQLANPHKILEYLSSGKVTVATYTDEYKDKRYLLEMVDHNDKFIDRFTQVISNLEEHNSFEKQMMRIEYAQEHTYENQIACMAQLIETHVE